ncbi:MAG TPA: alpha/beta hydrolase-fold protein [Gammaproteobacteria bacterium]|nr:alpha/beta hydrolase-fold protein [Gammaproteobacteria bacterium]
MKETFRWRSERFGQQASLVRWGHYGTPVLIFPTAGGDAEEIERFHLVGALMPLIEAGRIKIYSIDSIAGRAWLTGVESPEYCSRLQNVFDAFVYHEVLPLIRHDCETAGIEVVATGASIGAFNAVASVCRHPDAFRLAIGMSGTFDLSKYLRGRVTQDFYFSSPLHYLPGLEGPQLDMLRRRFVLLPTGEGRWEDPGESWRMAQVLGSKGVPNRVDPWGPQWDHNWVTWREMLPKYLDELS